MKIKSLDLDSLFGLTKFEYDNYCLMKFDNPVLSVSISNNNNFIALVKDLKMLCYYILKTKKLIELF